MIYIVSCHADPTGPWDDYERDFECGSRSEAEAKADELRASGLIAFISELPDDDEVRS